VRQIRFLDWRLAVEEGKLVHEQVLSHGVSGFNGSPEGLHLHSAVRGPSISNEVGSNRKSTDVRGGPR
jgi:ribosomal protein S6E (S10)